LFSNVAKWNIGLLDPLIGALDVEDDIITLGSVTPDNTSYQSGWIKVGDGPVDFVLMVRPVTADGFQNSYVPGTTAAIKVTIGPTAPLQDVSGFSVSASYGSFDATGKTALIVVPNFVPPADDPTWANIDFWWQDPSGAWKVLNSPAVGGVASEAVISQLPTAAFSTNFLAVSKDANGLDRDGNASTDPTMPPAGTPAFGPLNIEPPNVAVPLSDVTNFSVSFTYSAPDNDGKFNLLEVPSFTPPVSTQWGWIEFWGTDAGQSWRVLGDPSSPGAAGEAVIPQLPSAAFNAVFLAVSQDVNGKDKNGNAATPTGHCNTSGNMVAWVDGITFTAAMNGKTFWIGNTAYMVAASGFIDQHNLTLTSSPGNQSGASWVCPAQGTPSFGPLTITPPGLGSLGQEFAGVVTGQGISIGPNQPRADGSYNQPITPTFIPPANDTRWFSVDIVIKYADGSVWTLARAVRNSGETFTWNVVAGSQTARFYFVSRNVAGDKNSIQDPGVTPFVDKVVGSTSQLDFSQAKLSSFNQNQLRINPSTGQFEAYTIDSAIIGFLQIGGGNANGLCSTTTANNIVTSTSGSFGSYMPHTLLWIRGVNYVVTAFIDAAHVIIDRNAGNSTNVPWSWGMNPQLKVFDRGGLQIGFWGDDSFNTGFVGLFAGRNVRLGGTISSPILQVDSAGAVTINGATFTLVLNGVMTQINNQAGFGPGGGYVGGLVVTHQATGLAIGITGNSMIFVGSSFVSGGTSGFFRTGSGWSLLMDQVSCLTLVGSTLKFLQNIPAPTTATGGSGVLPTNPVGFLLFTDTSGNTRKIPYYAN
jgi:hypothetical protein